MENPILKAIVFICFIIPWLMLKALWDLLTDDLDWKAFFWRLPYVLIVILVIFALFLWFHGYR